MRYLLIDTSFLLEMMKLGKNLISQSENFLGEKLIPSTTTNVINELKSLSVGKDKKSRLANLALKLSLNFNKIFESQEKYTDLDLINIGIKNNCVIATADLELAHKAFNKGIDVIILKEKGRLSVLRY
jgi:Uncharacterized proteins of PilT N-term./Vapc superfamily